MEKSTEELIAECDSRAAASVARRAFKDADYTIGKKGRWGFTAHDPKDDDYRILARADDEIWFAFQERKPNGKWKTTRYMGEITSGTVGMASDRDMRKDFYLTIMWYLGC
jgi:hypothetical protein